MYSITIGLTYDEPLNLENTYRYDFVCFDLERKWGRGPLMGGVFVFRTILEGKAAGNVLVDLIDHSNVNAFDIALHGNAYIHTLDTEKIIKQKSFPITEKIIVSAMKNESNNIEFQAVIKEQIYEITNNFFSEERNFRNYNEIKYMLFTKYEQGIANMKEYSLAPIFNLQKEHIWYQNRYRKFNDLTKLDIDKYVMNKLNPDTSWAKVKETIETERERWGEKERRKFDELLESKKIQKAFPIER